MFETIFEFFFKNSNEKVFKKILWPLDKFCRVKPLHEESFEMKQHVVLLGFNEIGMEIAEYFRREHGQDVLCVQLDPALHEKFKSLFKLNAAKAAKESGTGAESKVFSNIFSHMCPLQKTLSNSLFKQAVHFFQKSL